MNSTIELLNLWANRCLDFAWPMLWQSSLLIAVVLALDFTLRKRLRPAVLHLVWMLVLVKLLIPPSLAVPCGVGWWLRPGSAAVTTPSVPASVVVYGDTAPVADLPPGPSQALAAPALSAAGWGLLLAGSVSVALMLWMLLRWRAVLRDTREAVPAPDVVWNLLEETRRSAGWRWPVRLRIVEGATSPAMCGLFRPTILVPRLLVERLTPKQLRGILLHELVHLRRGDVWVNCVQTLLQILYWWHPLLWLANSRIRQVREEAVDEAVIAGLQTEAEEYVPTLLEVARMALRRPLSSLGLVGILESQGALKQRIRRLLAFRPCASARLSVGVAWICCVAGFGAVAIPMGQAPASPPPAAEESPPAKEAAPPKAAALARAGKLLFEAGKLDEAEKVIKEGLRSDPTNQVLYYYANLIAEAKHGGTTNSAAAARPEIQVHVRGRFVEVPADWGDSFWTMLNTNGAGVNWPLTGFLTQPQASVLVKALEETPGAVLLSESSIVTLSGRQARIMTGESQSVVTNINPAALVAPGISRQAEERGELYQAGAMPFGAMLDITPWVSADAREITLTVKATVKEFKGFADEDKTQEVTVYVEGEPRRISRPRPITSTREVETKVRMPDGEVLIIVGQPEAPSASANNGSVNKRLIVLLTPTAVDPAGNRLNKATTN